MGDGVFGSRVGGLHGAAALGASAFSAASARATTVPARGAAKAGFAQNAAVVRTENAMATVANTIDNEEPQNCR